MMKRKILLWVWLAVVILFICSPWISEQLRHTPQETTPGIHEAMASMEIKEPEVDFAQLSEQAIEPEEQVEEELLDPWKVLVDQVYYFMGNRPLANYADVIAKACYETGMEPYWFCTIAIHESSGGQYCFRPYNAWGWKAGDWSSWEESIPAYCEAFVSIYGSGLTSSNHMKYDPKGSYYVYF